MKRVVTALLLIPAVLYVVFLAHPIVFLAAVALVAVLCFHEYQGLASAHGWTLAGPFGFAAGLLLLAIPLSEFAAALVVCTLAMLVLTLRHQNLSLVLPTSAALVLGLVYVFAPWRLAVELRQMNPHWLLFAMALCWVGDTAAFGAGKVFGRHKLVPRLSPAKSWEGAAASLAASVLFGLFYLTRFIPQFPPAHAVALSAVANLAGQSGDLVESALKRGAGVKDSGVILPGHGGFLDRVDSTLFSVPIVYFWLATFRLLAL